MSSEQTLTGSAGTHLLGERVHVLNGASSWMKRHNYWMDDMGDSIDGRVGVVVADYTSLPGDDSHVGIDFGDGTMIGVNLMWLIAASE